MEIAARTMHSIPYIKFIHVQPTAYIYSMQNPTAAAAHIEGLFTWWSSILANISLRCVYCLAHGFNLYSN